MKRLSLVQYRSPNGERAVAALVGSEEPKRLRGVLSVYDVASTLGRQGGTLWDFVAHRITDETVDIELAERERRLLPPIDHPDAAHLMVTGTGLTHLGSAAQRDMMHAATANKEQTDSMRMFLMGVEGGKPADDYLGVQPEWFYKGNGTTMVASGQPLLSPSFATDAGEEPELAGIYLIGEDGMPIRLGFCLANEFSDHLMESKNYLWLSHSKLRPVSLGPELLTGELPKDIAGNVRIYRGREVFWEKPFLSGENNMSHSLRNLEAHYFKYALFRNPGDIHVHLFGTATLSFADGVQPRAGDQFEIAADCFRHPLRNSLEQDSAVPVTITHL